MTALIVIASAAVLLAPAALVWAARRRIVVHVRGDSMLPTLHDGDRVVARRYTGGRIEVGSIVVFARPPLNHAAMVSERPGAGLADWWVKRVVAGPGDPVPPSVAGAVPGVERVPPGALVVLGDNAGLDSRAFGLVRSASVLGLVRGPGRP